MKRPFLCLVLVILVLLGCRKDTASDKSRGLLGVTPWPADFTLEEQQKALAFISADCDLVSHHFDDGIPYQESFTSSDMPSGLMADVQFIKSQTAGKKRLLSVSALDLSRKAMASYYRDSLAVSAAIRQHWKSLPIDHPDRITAYVKYIGWLVDQFKPDWINYGVESNLAEWDPAEFQQYKKFLQQVYKALKASYPQTPIFLSLMVTEQALSIAHARELLPFSDYVALSAYPYTHVSSSSNGNTDPSLFPDRYFEQWLDLAPEKPWCFAETAYIAEPLSVPEYSLNKEGNAAWQKTYLDQLLKLLDQRKGQFLVWFCYKDYNAAIKRLKESGQYQPLFSFWQDTGLFDEKNQTRPALQSWRNYRK